MNIAIYARYSSTSQTEASIEGQLMVCRKYADDNQYTVVAEYIDRAKSASKDVEKRTEFQKMIRDSAKGNFQLVLVYQLDRFARNKFDSATYKARLKKNGIRVISAKETISDDPSGILMESVLEGMAEYYSAELSLKIRRGQQLNVEKLQVVTGGHPFGFKVENKKLAIDEETAPYVRKIYEMYNSGTNMVKLRDYMNGLGIVNTKGNKFQLSQIDRILKNKRYAGYYIYKDTEVKDGIPAIISEELFNEVQVKMEKNKKAPARSKAVEEQYILTGKLFCGYCRNPMAGDSGTSHTGKVHHYYTCLTVKKHKGPCKKKSERKTHIEDYIIRECLWLLTDENIKIIADNVMLAVEREKRQSRYASLSKSLKDVEKRKDNLINSLTNTDNQNIIKKIYEKLDDLDKQGVEIQREMFREENIQNSLTKETIVDFLTNLKRRSTDDFSYRQLLVDVLVNKIYLYDDKLEMFLNTQNDQIEVDIDTEFYEGGEVIPTDEPPVWDDNEWENFPSSDITLHSALKGPYSNLH